MALPPVFAESELINTPLEPVWNYIECSKLTHIKQYERLSMRQSYPSDISREQFELIRSDLESARKKTKPRKLELYDIFCAIYYVLKSGCQWRMLPRDFPKWQTVYFYFQIWNEKQEDNKDSVFEAVLKKISGTNTYRNWQKRTDEFLYNRRSKCEEH